MPRFLLAPPPPSLLQSPPAQRRWVTWLLRLTAGCLLLMAFALGCFMLAHPAAAQNFSLNLGDQGTANGGLTGRVFQIIALMTVLSLAPGILMMVTSFTRIVIVLSLLGVALTQGARALERRLALWKETERAP